MTMRPILKPSQIPLQQIQIENPATHAAINVTGARSLRELCDTFMPEAESETTDSDSDSVSILTDRLSSE